MKKRILWIAGGAVALVALVVGICYLVVAANASGRTIDRVEDVPHTRVGLLLATSPITRNGAHQTDKSTLIQSTPTRTMVLIARAAYRSYCRAWRNRGGKTMAALSRTWDGNNRTVDGEER